MKKETGTSVNFISNRVSMILTSIYIFLFIKIWPYLFKMLHSELNPFTFIAGIIIFIAGLAIFFAIGIMAIKLINPKLFKKLFKT